MNFGAIIPMLTGAVGRAVDNLIPDKAKAAELQASITSELIKSGNVELQGAVDIIRAEAQGESWLQRNWRPILMLTIVAIIANNYLIKPYITALFGVELPTLDLPTRLWDLMTLGVGGYVTGRSLEKVAETWGKSRRG